MKTYWQKEYIITRLGELPIINVIWEKTGNARCETEQRVFMSNWKPARVILERRSGILRSEHRW
ncbi:hypothetical protein [Marinococcus halophilus]|uniref:hypothetical protein n=1 Tax=Marinococcus halophilus TaxID=1371 RepID=UPI0011BD5F88|nr:hypothetical protein [Marinococcus halophilus]